MSLFFLRGAANEIKEVYQDSAQQWQHTRINITVLTKRDDCKTDRVFTMIDTTMVPAVPSQDQKQAALLSGAPMLPLALTNKRRNIKGKQEQAALPTSNKKNKDNKNTVQKARITVIRPMYVDI